MKQISSYDEKLKEFKKLVSEVEYLKYTLNSLIYWDKITYMPPEGIEYRTKVMSYLADKQYRLVSGREFAEYVKYFKDNKRNDRVTDAMIKRICRNSEFVSKIPEEEYSRYIELVAVSEQVWEQAKAEDDFEKLRPYLEEIFDTFKRFAAYWSDGNDPYGALMGYYEEGLTTEAVDEIVRSVKPVLIRMASQAGKGKTTGGKSQKNGANLKMPIVDGRRQQLLWERVLADMGFSFSAGRIDVGAHPTILASSPKDVRIVNSYAEDDIRFGLFNVLHSGGKAIYQQSIDPKLMGTLLAEAPSFAMEEIIGRFYENIIGRSRGFWTYFYGNMCRIVEEMKEFSAEELFDEVNSARPSLIRIEADRLTYLIHIIIRYELERDIIEGRLEVAELPEAWNKKYRDYLGVEPAKDSEGVLQDIHWAAGYVGYFPSYFVASLSVAQIASAIEKDCGSIDKLAGEGQFDVIKGWLDQKIFRHGAVYTTKKLVEMATGKPLSADDYIGYLRENFPEYIKLK